MEASNPEKRHSNKRAYLLLAILAIGVLGLAEALVLSNIITYRVSVDEVIVTSSPSGDVIVPAGFTETRVYTVETSQTFSGRLTLTIINATALSTSINPASFEVTIGGASVTSLGNVGPTMAFVGPTSSISNGTTITVTVHFVGQEDFQNRIIPGTMYDFQAVVSQ